MTIINKTMECKVSKSTDIRKMTIEYFQKSGFIHRNNANSDSKILFERGSILSNM